MLNTKQVQVQTGDVLCVTKQDLLGEAIRFFTKGRCSHSVIVVQVEGIFMGAQMMSDGCEIVSLKQFLYDYDKNILVGIKRIPKLTAGQLDQWNAIILDMVDSAPKYDWDGDISFISPVCIEDAKDKYCSEFAEASANKIGETFSTWELVRGNPKYREWFGLGKMKKVLSPDDILDGYGSIFVV